MEDKKEFNQNDYIRDYKKKKYKQVVLLLKPEEKEKLQRFLKNKNITLKKYIFLKMEEDQNK